MKKSLSFKLTELCQVLSRLNSSLLKNGIQMPKRDTVNKNK